MAYKKRTRKSKKRASRFSPTPGLRPFHMQKVAKKLIKNSGRAQLFDRHGAICGANK